MLVAEIGQDIEAAGAEEIVLHPADEISDHLGQTQRENHKVNARKAKCGQPD